MKKFIICSIAVFTLTLTSYVAAFAQFDFGDATDPAYPSLLRSNGARHRDISRAWLGAIVGSEEDARIRDLDIGDDGLARIDPVTFRVTAAPLPAEPRAWYWRVIDFFSGRGRNRLYFLNVLIDRNNNGTWESPGEWVAQNQRITVPAGGTIEVRVVGATGEDILWDRAEEGWMRATLTDARLRNYDGTSRSPFSVGETEDYAPTEIKIEEPPLSVWCFVEEKVCRVLTKEEANEARDNKNELKGPYTTLAACTLDCGEKPPTIETPTPQRKIPPPQEPAEPTISTKSPATESQSPEILNKIGCLSNENPACFSGDVYCVDTSGISRQSRYIGEGLGSSAACTGYYFDPSSAYYGNPSGAQWTCLRYGENGVADYLIDGVRPVFAQNPLPKCVGQ